MKNKYSHRTTPEQINQLDADEVFVFGSNIRGSHGSGAARQALQWGAKLGEGVGLNGQTYAIPTMFSSAKEIVPYVNEFINFAQVNAKKKFLVTKIG